MKKQYSITIFFIFSLILTNSQLSYTNISYYSKQNIVLRTLVEESSLIEFITIEYDTNFTDYGFPGNGTAENHYRIEYYSLNELEYHNGIVIINTTKHFVFQNCHLMALWSAIYIENISDGTAVIRENTLLKSDVGIAVKNSNGVQIINNICGPYNNFGIFLSNTSNSMVKQNTGFQNEDYAICSVESVSNFYWNNNYSFNINAGMVLYQESNATILNNICNYNSRGGFFEVTNSTIKGNMFDNNHFYGSIFTKTGSSTISYNLFCYNTEYGCFVEDVDNSIFIGNYIANNSNYGLLLNKFSSNNLVYHNSFIGNNPGGTSQARDNGEAGSNRWYNQELKEGNYWSEWQKSKPYPLDGLAESMDKYPLNSSLERLDIKFSYFIISFLLIGIAAILKRNLFHNLS